MLRSVIRVALGAVAVAAIALALPPAGTAQTKDDKKALKLSPSRVEVDATTNAAWKVAVAVDKSDKSYTVGDEVAITVTSEQPGYLYVVNVDAEGNIHCLYPNQYQAKLEIAANTPVTIPDPGNKKFRFKADKAGKELIKAIVTAEEIKSIDSKDLLTRSVTKFDRRKFIRLATEAMGGDPDKVPVEITTTTPTVDQKPEVVVQKQKIEAEKPDVFVKKKKEWATGELEILIAATKPDQTQDKKKE